MSPDIIEEMEQTEIMKNIGLSEIIARWLWRRPIEPKPDNRTSIEAPQWALEAAQAIFNDRRFYESNEAMIAGHAALIAKVLKRGEEQ